MWKKLNQILIPQKKTKFKKRHPLDCEVFQKIEEISSKFNDGSKLKFYVGSHYWNQIPQVWKFDWERQQSRQGLVPVKKTEVKVQGATIVYDPENKFRFDIEST